MNPPSEGPGKDVLIKKKRWRDFVGKKELTSYSNVRVVFLTKDFKIHYRRGRTHDLLTRSNYAILGLMAFLLLIEVT